MKQLLPAILLLFSCYCMAQEKSPYPFNQAIAAAMADADADALLKYYDADAVVLPEYHQALTGKIAIAAFFRQWFTETGSNVLEFKVADIQRSGEYMIETGTFTNKFKRPSKDFYVYDCKYLRVWNLKKPDNPRLISEIWGANQYLDRAMLPEIIVAKPRFPASGVNNTTVRAIQVRNELITSLVRKRQGVAHGELFTTDAIYMPYYQPMKVGIDSVKAYFAAHEKPGDVQIDSLVIRAANMMNLGALVLEHGYYTVQWRAPDNNTGIVNGKSINIWKKGNDGNWYLYRQMVNHD